MITLSRCSGSFPVLRILAAGLSLSLVARVSLAADVPVANAATENARAPAVRLISFDDIKPAGARLTSCWDALGIDDRQRVYIALSDQSKQHPDDTVIFRYDSRSGHRKLMGSLRQISRDDGNLQEGETIAKSHVPFLKHGGKFYFGSHDYHSYKDRLEIARRRGGHFYSLDLATDHFEDLSKTDAQGISVPHQGIIAMDVLEPENRLAGLTFPFGDILIYDLNRRKTTLYPGVAGHRDSGKPARTIIATEDGKVYFSYYDTREAPVYEFDSHTGAIRETENRYHFGMVYGGLRTRDRSKVYLVDLFGNLYVFHVARAKVEDLGTILPRDQAEAGVEVKVCYSITLSPDEKKLYTFPSQLDGATGLKLYEHDLTTGQNRQVADFYPVLNGSVTGRKNADAHGRITGSGVVDEQGRLYFGYHEGGDEGRGVALLQVSLGAE